jgi:hypothetical protein
MQRLADYLQYLQADDLLAATEEAKVRARNLLEDQGVTVLALMLADFMADALWQGLRSPRELVSPMTPVPA